MKRVLMALFAAVVVYGARAEDGFDRTAFDELAVAQPSAKVQLQFPYNINLNLVSTTTAASAQVYQADGMAVLTSSGVAGSTVTLRSLDALKYNTGQGGLVRFTGLFTVCSASAAATQLIGLGDESDGLFFGCANGVFGILRRQNGTDNWTTQDNWNRVTLKNGSGPFHINVTKGNVYQIRYQWLGFGLIDFEVENPFTGKFVTVHSIQYANANTVPSIYNPTLPLFMGLYPGVATSTITLRSASMAAFIEGAEENFGVRRSSATSKSSITTATPVLVVKTTTTFAGKTNRVRVGVDFASLASNATGGGTNITTIKFILNPTFTTAPTYSLVDSNTSVVMVSTGAAVSGGREIMSFQQYATSFQVWEPPYSRREITLNPGDVLAITAESTSTSSLGLVLGWNEKF